MSSHPSWIDEVIASANPKTAQRIYWAGEVEFLSAAEGDVMGRTVKLRLVRGPEEHALVNPFAKATRKRKGFAGTFFEMTLSLLGGPEGGDDTMTLSTVLLGWSDGPKGATATLKISDEEEGGHPFMYFKRPSSEGPGTRWMAVFVELTDDVQPVNQQQAAICDSRIENAPVDHPPAKVKSYAQNAAILIQSPAFALYLQERVDGSRGWDAETIDTWLKAKLGITSKTELNAPGPARTAFDAIKSNYVEWSGRAQYSPL